MNQKSAIYSLSIASLLSFTASTNDPTTKLNYALKHLDSKEAKTQLIAEFPRDAKAFKEFCQERRTVLKDCSGLFENGVQKLIPKSEYAEPLAEILAGLVTEVKYGADAPNYLQRAWLTLCQGQPKAFVAAVENLPSAKQ